MIEARIALKLGGADRTFCPRELNPLALVMPQARCIFSFFSADISFVS